MDPRTRKQLLKKAKNQLKLSHIVTESGYADADVAAFMLLRGWGLLAELESGRKQDNVTDCVEFWKSQTPRFKNSPNAEERRESLARLESLSRAAGSLNAQVTPEDIELVAQYQEFLKTAINEKQWAAWNPRLKYFVKWGLPLLLLVLIGAVVINLITTRSDDSALVWRASYFNTEDFSGAPIVERMAKIDFYWRQGSPEPKINNDNFSARWDGCLKVERAMEITYQLASDDGSRLFIDGELALDNWGAHALQTKETKVAMKPGVHHLRVEFVEYRIAAIIQFKAKVGDDPLQPLGAPYLVPIDSDNLEDNPCLTLIPE